MRYLADQIYDDGLKYLDANAVAIHVCSRYPNDYTEATSTKSLGSKDVSTTDIAESEADGDVSGRKLVIKQITGISIDTNGEWDHIAIVDDTKRLLVTENAPKTVTAGETVEILSFKIEKRDPT